MAPLLGGSPVFHIFEDVRREYEESDGDQVPRLRTVAAL